MEKLNIEYIWFSENHITIPKDVKKELNLLAKKEICTQMTVSPEKTKGTLQSTLDGLEYHGEWNIAVNPLSEEEEDAGFKGCKIE